jgi:hypothetical protein
LGITVVQAEAILVLAAAERLSLEESGTRIVPATGNPTGNVNRDTSDPATSQTSALIGLYQ